MCGNASAYETISQHINGNDVHYDFRLFIIKRYFKWAARILGTEGIMVFFDLLCRKINKFSPNGQTKIKTKIFLILIFDQRLGWKTRAYSILILILIFDQRLGTALMSVLFGRLWIGRHPDLLLWVFSSNFDSFQAINCEWGYLFNNRRTNCHSVTFSATYLLI